MNIIKSTKHIKELYHLLSFVFYTVYAVPNLLGCESWAHPVFPNLGAFNHSTPEFGLVLLLFSKT
jgi:hypothetical protein